MIPAGIPPVIPKWWCESHKREATHRFPKGHPRHGQPCCDPDLPGILLPCECEPMVQEPDPEVSRAQARQIAAQLFQVDESAISLGRSGAKWLTVAIPHRPEGLTFRGKTWFDVLHGALKYLIACVVTNPEGAAQAAAAAKLGDN